MRTTILDTATTAESEELLTTGEVAKLLSSSRQHVVDLCNSGDLPYETVGTHRRIRRRDAEALKNRSQRMTRDQRRSLWLNTAVAGQLVADTDRTLALARRTLEVMQQTHTRGQGARWLQEWANILDGPVERILEVLTSSTPWAREMRQNSPFSGVLNEEERMRVLSQFRALDQARR